MQTVICSECRREVPRNAATIRSVSLREHVAWCRECKPLPAPVIPAQRTAPAAETVTR